MLHLSNPITILEPLGAVARQSLSGLNSSEGKDSKNEPVLAHKHNDYFIPLEKSREASGPGLRWKYNYYCIPLERGGEVETRTWAATQA